MAAYHYETDPPTHSLQEWLSLGGKFTLSDDSHGIAQLATHYPQALDYLESLGVDELWTLERVAPVLSAPDTQSGPEVKPKLLEKSVSLATVREALRSSEV